MEHDRITPAEKALLFALEEDLKGLNGLKVLVAGNRSGHLPCALAQAGADVTAHLFDCYHVQAMRTRLHEAGFDADAIIRCTAQIPEGPYDRAYFMTTPLSMTGELVLDQLEDIRANLALGGQLFAGDPFPLIEGQLPDQPPKAPLPIRGIGGLAAAVQGLDLGEQPADPAEEGRRGLLLPVGGEGVAEV